MGVVRPAIVGLVVGAALAFLVALLWRRNPSGYLSASLGTADPVGAER